AQPQVLDPRTRFELVGRDGVVFYNDPQTEHAGVLRLDGGFTAVPKYDPKHPGNGVTGAKPGENAPANLPTAPAPGSGDASGPASAPAPPTQSAPAPGPAAPPPPAPPFQPADPGGGQ